MRNKKDRTVKDKAYVSNYYQWMNKWMTQLANNLSWKLNFEEILDSSFIANCTAYFWNVISIID